MNKFAGFTAFSEMEKRDGIHERQMFIKADHMGDSDRQTKGRTREVPDSPIARKSESKNAPPSFWLPAITALAPSAEVYAEIRTVSCRFAP